jgi:hypothetical protein
MYIGYISVVGDIVESVKIDTEDSATATNILSRYVYEKYNKDNENDYGYVYHGSLVNLDTIQDISSYNSKSIVASK